MTVRLTKDSRLASAVFAESWTGIGRAVALAFAREGAKVAVALSAASETAGLGP